MISNEAKWLKNFQNVIGNEIITLSSVGAIHCLVVASSGGGLVDIQFPVSSVYSDADADQNNLQFQVPANGSIVIPFERPVLVSSIRIEVFAATNYWINFLVSGAGLTNI